MKAARLTLVSLGCVCVFAAHAEQIAQDQTISESREAAGAGSNVIERSLIETMLLYPISRREDDLLRGVSWRFDYGAIETLHNVVGFWPSIHWLNSSNVTTSMASLGYTWRNLKLEGALFRARDSGYHHNRNTEFIKLDSVTSKLTSYDLAPNWKLQISRGFQAGPDQFNYQRVRRTTASATYRSNFEGHPWNTTIAWGRAKDDSVGSAYLVESAMRINGVHTIFGRFERAGNDELFRGEEASHTQSYAARKFTLGYLYDVYRQGPTKLTIGGLASHRSVPEVLLPYYGEKSMAYMVFVRLNIQIGGR